MRIARVRVDTSVHLARIEDDGVVLLATESGHPSADALREALAAGVDLSGDGPRVDLDAVELLAPLANPSKVLAIGLNYADHARESAMEVPAAPVVFAKTPNAIVGPGATITWGRDVSDQVDYEAELAAVIGMETGPAADRRRPSIFGFTCCNDVSARDAQFGDGQWLRGKSLDTFCPLGPWIVTADEIVDPQRLRITCDVNGERLQDGTTADMIHPVEALIDYLAPQLRLLPGDVVTTGTPWGVGFARTPPRFLGQGDVVTVTIEGIGALTNRCAVR